MRNAAINCSIQSDGSLRLTADNETRAEIADMQRREKSSDDILWTLTESYWTNGRYEPFNAEDANPFVGLSSAPCIAEAMTVHDDGQKEIIGRFWFYADYMVSDAMDELKRRGYSIWQSGD